MKKMIARGTWAMAAIGVVAVTTWVALPYAVADEHEVRTKKVEGFGGVIAKSYKESVEWWPEPVRPHEDAPNVIIFLLDDVGF